MIGQISGIITFRGGTFLIIECGGVGYKIFTTSETLRKTAEKITLWVHTAVRESAIDLYGFPERNELELFELLLSVSGIGPKSALSVLSLVPADTLRRGIASGDTTYLTKVSGIGKKIAEKIVVELRDKLGGVGDGIMAHSELKEDADVIEALETLGYSTRDARAALHNVSPSIEGAELRVKAALKNLSKQ